jgi:hypothetical protein
MSKQVAYIVTVVGMITIVRSGVYGQACTSGEHVDDCLDAVRRCFECGSALAEAEHRERAHDPE